MSNRIIFHTKNYKYLADEILDIVKNKHVNFDNDNGIVSGKLFTEEFPDGEIYHRIDSNIVDKDVYLIGGTIDDKETMELYDLSSALTEQRAKSLTIITPYLGYSTMERAKPGSGEIVKAKNRARLLSSIPHGNIRNRIFLIDLHAEGIPYYFEGSTQTVHLYAKDIISEICDEIQENNPDDFVLGSTDAGRAKWIESLSKDMGVDCAIIIKRRVSGSDTQITGISADVMNKTVIIYDDMVRTGGSLKKAAKAYIEAGATKVFAIATHGVFPNDSVKELENCGHLEAVYVTNTHPSAIKDKYNKNFLRVKSIAPLIYNSIFSSGMLN